MTFGVIVAARLASRRLPGKALLPLMGLPVLKLVLRRLKTSREAGAIILATTTNAEDARLAQCAVEESVEVYRGAVDDVLGRYACAARLGTFTHVVRVTADCPWVSGETLDPVLARCRDEKGFDLVTTKPAYPHGIDYEVFSRELLEQLDRRKDLESADREHILNYVYRHEERFKIVRLSPPKELITKEAHFLLDTPDDYERMNRMLTGIADSHVSAP